MHQQRRCEGLKAGPADSNLLSKRRRGVYLFHCKHPPSPHMPRPGALAHWRGGAKGVRTARRALATVDLRALLRFARKCRLKLIYAYARVSSPVRSRISGGNRQHSGRRDMETWKRELVVHASKCIVSRFLSVCADCKLCALQRSAPPALQSGMATPKETPTAPPMIPT